MACKGLANKWVISTLRCVAALGLLAGLAMPVRAESLPAPTRLDMLGTRQLVVSDPLRDAIFVLNAGSLAIEREIPVQGDALSVAYSRGRIYVGNATRQTVEVRTRSGGHRFDLGGEGSVARPLDIAVDSGKGWVFVVDGASNQIKVFSVRGALEFTLPAPGMPPLEGPAALAVDPLREEVLVSEYGKPGGFAPKAWLRIYGYDGTLHGAISGRQHPGFGFSRPQGLAVSPTGLIFLVDAVRAQVLVFDRGTLLPMGVIGAAGHGAGELFFPLDAALDESGQRLFVTNKGGMRVDAYDALTWR